MGTVLRIKRDRNGRGSTSFIGKIHREASGGADANTYLNPLECFVALPCRLRPKSCHVVGSEGAFGKSTLFRKMKVELRRLTWRGVNCVMIGIVRSNGMKSSNSTFVYTYFGHSHFSKWLK